MAGDKSATEPRHRWRAVWRAVRKWNWREVRKWAMLVVVALGLAGVFVSYRSLKQSSHDAAETNATTRYQTISERLLDMDAALVEHPDLMPYFRDGRTLDNNVDARTSQTVVALAVERVDYDEYLYVQLLNLGGMVPPSRLFVLRTPDGPSTVNVNDDWLAWSEAIEGDFRDSPPMCGVVTKYMKSYSITFIHALAEAGVCPGLHAGSN